ncbi:FecR family protein [Leptolyngbya iicbica]|uniref:FecR protein domain-containing protein n=2 Tax=Cyanophyceae TaxID=3028117 RepID=A0A4Q7E2Y1_9CYAN|nr:FecR family protein [Leptolyngbya sp. LK]RZM76046.1 hypothetical protein DYY88_19315 [Leptolyngbya sp. LK]
MNRFFRMSSLQLVGWPSLVLGLLGILSAASPAQGQVPLTRADVESLYNQVEFIPEGQTARPARLSDWLAVGDALRTALGARAELRFNDGSLARVGERATFWFVPNTRDFRLSNGTALFLIPPDRGPSNIRTPSAVTGIQGTALVVRHIPHQACDAAEPSVNELTCPGRTVVMVLTNSPKGPVEVTASNGNSAFLSAGDLAVVENGDIQVMEFNLQLFYDTSPLVSGLELDNPNFEGTGLPTDPVRQETWEGLQSQTDFNGSYLLNPSVVALNAQLGTTVSWLLPADGGDSPTFANDTAATPLSALESLENTAIVQNPVRQSLMSTWPPRTVPGLEVPQASVPGVVIPTGPSSQPAGVIRPVIPNVGGPGPIGPPSREPGVVTGGPPVGVPPVEQPVGVPPVEQPGGGPPPEFPGAPEEFPGAPEEFPAGPNDDPPEVPDPGDNGPELEVPFDPAG